MKYLILTAALTLASPALAQADKPIEDGLDKLNEGSRLLLEGLMGEIGPMLESLTEEVSPLLEDLQQQLGEAFEGLNAYHPPEILPNGDIILRKKTEADDPVTAPIDL